MSTASPTTMNLRHVIERHSRYQQHPDLLVNQGLIYRLVSVDSRACHGLMNPIRGLMTWSANWDVGQDVNGKSYNNEFATRYSTSSIPICW
jgi:hypothetical protein